MLCAHRLLGAEHHIIDVQPALLKLGLHHSQCEGRCNLITVPLREESVQERLWQGKVSSNNLPPSLIIPLSSPQTSYTYVCVPGRSCLILSCICVRSGVWLLVLLPNLPLLTCLSMSTLESVTYLPEKGLYCQRLPSSRTHGGTDSLKGKNTENMGFYGTLKMIFYKVSNLWVVSSFRYMF